MNHIMGNTAAQCFGNQFQNAASQGSPLGAYQQASAMQIMAQQQLLMQQSALATYAANNRSMGDMNALICFGANTSRRQLEQPRSRSRLSVIRRMGFGGKAIAKRNCYGIDNKGAE